ncbi:MAG TPA: hypothetical protein DCL61_03910 [Cyanobacteria bacterium UBA12227]|nr:hypothetical protein [Cyanobacteria bacterium UBA12227]HAX88645.1 hypothetical protein [Cyanobacteria bacterium UBA11370]HBY81063.1 hypothetical protein [Cyanobacteria bacterium UBA11148]
MSNILTEVEKKVKKKVGHILRVPKVWLRHLSEPEEPYGYIFHHIPKCAGTSAFDALTHWFICIKDYPPSRAWGNVDDPKAYDQFCNSSKNLEQLRHYQILCGHYHLKGSFISERYPSCFEKDRYRLITFLRDPLEVQISLYYYERRMKRFPPEEPLEKRLLERENYLASVIPCDDSNYQEVLNRYFFIGLVEKYQESFDRLADQLRKPRLQLTTLNQSVRDQQKLSEDLISEFKERNHLDYKIYHYAKSLYEKNDRSIV